MNRLLFVNCFDMLTRLSFILFMGDLKATKEAKTVCAECDLNCHHFGRHRNSLRRFRCPQCGKTYAEPHRLTLGEMYADESKITLALQLLLEGTPSAVRCGSPAWTRTPS